MVTIATVNTLQQALILKSRLEDAGIPASIPDEFAAQHAWTVASAAHGVRVQVDPKHEADARIVAGTEMSDDPVDP